MKDTLKILLVMAAPHRNALAPFLLLDRVDVRLATDCRRARQLLQAETFDLVFTDASLPDGNWLTISSALNYLDQPAELVVCLPSQADRLAAIVSTGSLKVLMPPLEAETIRRLLENALRGRAAHVPALREELPYEPQLAAAGWR